MRRISPFAAIVIAFVLLVVAARPAVAQFTGTWKIVSSFPTVIGCGFFFDENHGLIGSGVRWTALPSDPQVPCAIYKTTNGGQTWQSCTVPASISGAVSSIWMQDADTGYASIFPSVSYNLSGTFGGSSLWKTTDGGNIWFDPYHVDHAMSCVYGQNGLIVFTIWDYYESNFSSPDTWGGDFSYDGGLTWQQSKFRRGNGIAFSDNLNGVVTEMNSTSGGSNHWYTMDAGRTWMATSTDQYESWSVYAPPGKHTFFTANESQLGIPHQSVNWSTDGGMTWTERASFAHMQFTGTIAGVNNTLYVQTDTVYAPDPSLQFYPDQAIVRGIYRSDDLGATWHFVGGPSHSRDTRFVVTGCGGAVVYAFDPNGNVWKTTDGGDGTLPSKYDVSHLLFPGLGNGNPAYTFVPDGPSPDCRPIAGHIQYSLQGCTTSGVLDTAWITGSSAFQLTDGKQLPRSVSADSIGVTYFGTGTPTALPARNDTGYLHLRYQLASGIADTILMLVGQSPTLSAQNMAVQGLAVRAASFGQTVDMPLMEVLNPASVDSLRLSGLRTLNMTLTFDSSRLAFVSYTPPSGLSTVSVNPRAGAVDIAAQNSSWTYTPGELNDFDMGTARFQILAHPGGSSLITLSDLGIVTSDGGVVHPCLGSEEDRMWQVEIINTADVQPANTISGLTFAPSLFADHICVANSDTHPVSLTLCDLLGRTVSTYDAQPSSHTEWPTSDIRPGSYFIVWHENGTLRSSRLNRVE